jgi:hypothetical protein
MTGMMRVPRTRGALSGVLLILLGAWGGLIPFVGPHFHYAYTPDATWSYTTGRLVLEVLPGAATVLGGLIMLATRSRPVAILGTWLAAASGAWFAAGGILSVLWTRSGTAETGSPVGGTVARVGEQIGFFTGLGIVIVFLAALALGRFAVIGVRETKLAERENEVVPDQAPVPARTSAAPVTVAAPSGASTPARASAADNASTADAVSTAAEAGTTDDASRADQAADAPDKVTVTS